ncbi:MAG TPA: hypothetical protein VN848_10435 [Gemmatimonadales bacterium]|nr:hypothetical protein [Gemmatimonadales bacterium]
MTPYARSLTAFASRSDVFVRSDSLLVTLARTLTIPPLGKH